MSKKLNILMDTAIHY